MGANSGIYLGPLSPIKQGKPFHEVPPLLVGSGSFTIDNRKIAADARIASRRTRSHGPH